MTLAETEQMSPRRHDDAVKPAARVDVGVSERAIQIARIVDRLRPGTYTIRLIKDDLRAVDWKIEIIKTELIQKMALSKSGYVPE